MCLDTQSTRLEVHCLDFGYHDGVRRQRVGSQKDVAAKCCKQKGAERVAKYIMRCFHLECELLRGLDTKEEHVFGPNRSMLDAGDRHMLPIWCCKLGPNGQKISLDPQHAAASKCAQQLNVAQASKRHKPGVASGKPDQSQPHTWQTSEVEWWNTNGWWYSCESGRETFRTGWSVSDKWSYGQPASGNDWYDHAEPGSGDELDVPWH